MQTGFGRYRLVRHLATGGMGEVYLAEAMGAAGFAKRLVIKTLRADLAADADLVKQFVAEGQLLEALDHPNIAQILDLGLQDGTYFLAMEFVEGFDLRALHRALPAPDGVQRLGEASVLYVVASVARALDHAASRRGQDGKALRIVHHDVTPSNVMVRRDGHVKLVDFGVARSAVMSRMSAGALRGKLPYLSPEHARHQRVDGRADLFALGLCAYEWLSGQRALEVAEADSLEDAYQRLPRKLDALQGHLGEGALGLLRDLVQVDVALRARSAGEVADRAEALVVASGVASPPRALALELEPAFEVLQARAGSFDQTLAQLLGVAAQDADARTGTLSLPGLEAVQVAAASARNDGGMAATPPPRRPRGFKRLATGAFGLLAAAVAVGWWMGARQLPVPTEKPAIVAPMMAPPVQESLALPLPQQASPVVAAAAAIARLIVARETPKATAVLPEAATDTASGTPGKDAGATVGSEGDLDPKRKDRADSTMEFKVFPADCEVRVDGDLASPVEPGGNHYRVRVKPGSHRIRVRDPASPDQPATETVTDLKPGENRKLKGFNLGKGLP